MLRNYFKTALRNIRRNRIYSLINILGLAIGIACFLLIVFYIQHERSYDSFHKRGENIYQVVRINKQGDWEGQRVNTGAPLAPLLVGNLSGIEKAVRFTCFRNDLIGFGENRFIERRFFFADESVFDVFTFPLALGDPSTALSEPFTVVLTPQTARKYFGDQDPVNGVLTYYFGGKAVDFRVTGVLEKIPQNSHIDFDFLASYDSLLSIAGEYFITKHWDSPTWTYVLLRDGVNPESIDRLLPAFTEKHVDKRSFTSVNHKLLALKDVYFHSPGPSIGKMGNLQYLFIFTIIAVFILLIACINFMNLATARSGSRAKEIGMRKVVGAQRSQIVRQFLGESLVYSIFSLVLAVVLVELFLPRFSKLVGQELRIDYLRNSAYVLILLITTFLVGLIAGSYPAFFLSAFKPASVLKGKLRSGGSAIWVRKAMVVGQFVISIALIAGAVFIFQQIEYVKNRDLGFKKEQVITVPLRDRSVRSKYELLKNKWLQNANIQNVTACSMEPGVSSQNGISVKARGVEDLDIGIIYTDHDYARTLEIDLAAGRDFSASISTDANEAILINKTALATLGWQEGVGEEMELYFKEGGKIIPVYQGRVVGVVEDFNFRDLTTPMQPILIKIDPKRYSYALVRINGAEIDESIRHLQKSWQELALDYPFEFTFLEDDMNGVYRSVETFGSITRYGTFWAIFIACLGLFGLASFTVEKRTKEIGIRKVLGASIPGIMALINKDFLKLVILSNVIAWPIAYFGMTRFLQYFAYRMSIQVWAFLLTGCFALLVSFITVTFQAVKAAVLNPAKTLRYE
jgi:putative ABC transport system permease protein